MFRIGEGYDIHALGASAPLMLGCVEVSASGGAIGHSDGDVLAHAVCDAILGALGAGDIGQHFPPDDERWRGAASRRFLEGAAALLAARGGTLVNVDATVVLEAPKIGPFVGRMRDALAAALGCSATRVSVKAKTAEGFGWVGEGRAIEARAVALIDVPDEP